MRVYKGFETPCVIHGLLAQEFFLFWGLVAFMALLAIMLFNLSIKTGCWNILLIYISTTTLACFALHFKLYRRAHRRKYSNEGNPVNLTTRKIFI